MGGENRKMWPTVKKEVVGKNWSWNVGRVDECKVAITNMFKNWLKQKMVEMNHQMGNLSR